MSNFFNQATSDALKKALQGVFPVSDGFTVRVVDIRPNDFGRYSYIKEPHYSVEVSHPDCSPDKSHSSRIFLDFGLTYNTRLLGDVNLRKCDETKNGHFVLERLIRFAQLIGATINFLDISKIVIERCDLSIPLKTLYLLTKGMTWYNSQGFPLPPDEMGLMREQIMVPMSVFIEGLKAKLVKDDNSQYIQDKCDSEQSSDGDTLVITEHRVLDSYLQKFNITRTEYDKITVQNYFTKISELLKNKETNCTTIVEIKDFLLIIDNSNYLFSKEDVVWHPQQPQQQEQQQQQQQQEQQQQPQQQQQQEQQQQPHNAYGPVWNPQQLLKPLTPEERQARRDALRKKLGYRGRVEEDKGGKRTRKPIQKRRKTRRRKTKTRRRKSRR